MASLNVQVPSDVEESRINPDTEELRSEEEEQQLKFLKKWLGWLAFSGPAAVGITGYQLSQNIRNSNANGLLYAASLLMGFSIILAFILWIIANIVTGRQGFLKYLRYGAISVTVLFAVAVVGVIVAGFF